MMECTASISSIDWRQDGECANVTDRVHPKGEGLKMRLTLDNVTCSTTIYFYAITRSDIGSATCNREHF